MSGNRRCVVDLLESVERNVNRVGDDGLAHLELLMALTYAVLDVGDEIRDVSHAIHDLTTATEGIQRNVGALG